MSTFRLAHLSDPHLPPPPRPGGRQGLLSKRTLSRYAWRRKQARHSPDVLSAVLADIAESGVDHVAITGDLTNFSEPAEFAAAQAWLAGIGPPDRVTVSPGNHDALVPAGLEAGRASLAAHFGSATGPQPFPALRRHGPVSLINLCSAVATAPHLAQGRLGADQIAAAADLLRSEGAAGRYRVVLIHHPVTAGAVSSRKALVDQDALRDMLRSCGAELILHGHGHAARMGVVQGPRGPIAALGAPSASTPARTRGHDEPAQWRLIEIDGEPGAFRTWVTARQITPDGALRSLGRIELLA